MIAATAYKLNFKDDVDSRAWVTAIAEGPDLLRADGSTSFPWPPPEGYAFLVVIANTGTARAVAPVSVYLPLTLQRFEEFIASEPGREKAVFGVRARDLACEVPAVARALNVNLFDGE